MSHEVISDAGFGGDPSCESSEVKVLTRAGQAERAGRSIKRTLQLREDTPFVLDWRGTRGCRAPWRCCEDGIGREEIVKSTCWNHRSTDDGTSQRTGRANWGTSAAGAQAQDQADIIIKPPGGVQKLGYGHSKRRSCGTLQPMEEPRAIGPVRARG
jgi:hypothetical protein